MLERLRKNQLSPRERSFFSALFGAFVGVLSGVIEQLPTLMDGGKINITPVVINLFVLSFVLGFVRLWIEQSDPQLAKILQAYSEQLEDAALLAAHAPDGHVPVIHIVAPVPTPKATIEIVPAHVSDRSIDKIKTAPLPVPDVQQRTGPMAQIPPTPQISIAEFTGPMEPIASDTIAFKVEQMTPQEAGAVTLPHDKLPDGPFTILMDPSKPAQ